MNTTGENLKLDSNPCGKALSNEAGPTLQAECTKIGNLQVGQVAATKGGNLLCDEVYHVVCVQWNGGEGEQVCYLLITISDVNVRGGFGLHISSVVTREYPNNSMIV